MWALNILDETTNLPNKAGNTYKKLYHNEWKTKETVQVNSNDNSLRGFMGDYNMKIINSNTAAVIEEIEFKLEKDLDIYCEGDNSNVICF